MIFFSAPHFPHSINHLLCMTLLQKPHLESQMKPNNFGRQTYQSFVLDTFQMAQFLSSFAPSDDSAKSVFSKTIQILLAEL